MEKRSAPGAGKFREAEEIYKVTRDAVGQPFVTDQRH